MVCRSNTYPKQQKHDGTGLAGKARKTSKETEDRCPHFPRRPIRSALMETLTASGATDPTRAASTHSGRERGDGTPSTPNPIATTDPQI
jgi:hypothetical protein